MIRFYPDIQQQKIIQYAKNVVLKKKRRFIKRVKSLPFFVVLK